MVERYTGRSLYLEVEQRSADYLLYFIKQHVEAGSHILTDGWGAYISLEDEGFTHQTVSEFEKKKLKKNLKKEKMYVL
jgi:hypothetical protein